MASRAPQQTDGGSAFNREANGILEAHTFRRYNDILHQEEWRHLREIPAAAEIMPRKTLGPSEEEWNDYQKELVYDVNLPTNIIDGPWPSKGDYIGAHYRIHREDAIAPLRKSVEEFKRRTGMMESQDTAIYTNLTFKGLLCANVGIAFRVEFSTERSQKQIRWKQSKRLIPGTLVALSPQRDAFNSICKVGVVAARPIEGGLDQNPPQVDIFWGDIDDAVFDPVDKYIMLESRQGYFEASRHMLVALQKLMTERFHLSDHIVSLNPMIQAPQFLKDHPWLNLNPLIDREAQARETRGKLHDETVLDNVDALKGFPDVAYCNMDLSQKQACESMLTKQLSIVQGPPGTGKTHVSVAALKVMAANWVPGQPPIIITAQTNHAIDQLLNHIMAFETDVLRLGGRCEKENEAILRRTLYELRVSNQGVKGVPQFSDAYNSTRREYKSRVNDIIATMLPLTTGTFLTSEVLLESGIITQAQVDSLSEDGWGEDEGDAVKADLKGWLTEGQFTEIPRTPPINLGLEMEDAEIEYEQIHELEYEASGVAQGNSGVDSLGGTYISFNRTMTGKPCLAVGVHRLKKLCSKKDLYEIPVACRGEVYRAWEKQLNLQMLQALKSHMREYKEITQRYEVARGMSNLKLIKFLNIKIVACTTTGLSKYRGLLAALQPRIMVIEEAAETTEATVMAGMFDSLQQLVLVGDHKQLQANCNVRQLGAEPYHLNVSMFERLVNNGIRFTMLNQQRRMIKDARQLLTAGPEPFYHDLYDHPSVSDRKINRPPIPGMGGKDTWFFHHNWPEARNGEGSVYNLYEAEMISGFYNYLVLNGTDPSKITVLTFYNGQRKAILKELKANENLKQYPRFKVHTVDSYQGEENDIILLSLVRSNDHMGIGFLENRNRCVVALSRARRGLYMFGNTITLCVGEETEDYIGRSLLWRPILVQMRAQKRLDIDAGLPITCTKHGKTVKISEPGDWIGGAGGCKEKCPRALECGHPCPYLCHPFPHTDVICPAPCVRIVQSCGHCCSGSCGEPCYCAYCKLALPQPALQSAVGNTQSGRSGHGRSRNFSQPKNGKFSSPQDIRKEIGSGRGSSLALNLQSSSSSGTTNTPQRAAPFPGSRNDKKGPFANVAPVSSHITWQNFDAAASDREIRAREEKAEAERPVSDAPKVTFNEVFKKVRVGDDGRRVNVCVEKRFTQGIARNGKSETPKPSSKIDLLAKDVDGMNVSGSADVPLWHTELTAFETGELSPHVATTPSKAEPISTPSVKEQRTSVMNNKKAETFGETKPVKGASTQRVDDDEELLINFD